MPETTTITTIPGESDAATCRRFGIEAGDQLEGDEGYGPSIIQITAIGESHILARQISHNGIPEEHHEGLWTLSCREWQKIAA